MLNIYIPQPVHGAHAHERLVCADATRSGRHVFLHVAHYPDFAAPVESVELRQGDVCIKGHSIGHPETMAYQFEVPESCTNFRFNVHLDGAFCGRVEAQAFMPEQPVFLTAATLFKGDYAQVRTWMDYHAAMGFERFVLYYNGKLDAIVPELLAHTAVTDKDVLLVQWPYTYWVEGLGLGLEGLLAEQGDRADLSRCGKDWHHAQQMMLNHALLLLQGTTEYLGFFDLDEYFRMEQPGALVELLRRGQSDVYIFQSRWSELASGNVPTLADGADFFAHEDVLVSPDWVPFPGRTKYIARPQTILGTGAHVPKATVAGTRLVKVDTDLAGVYHFHCFSGKASRRQLVNPAGQWVSMPGFHTLGSALRSVQRDAA